MIKTWNERCEDHPDHNGIVTERMIQARMQEEIDELRAAIEQAQEPVAWMYVNTDGECEQIEYIENDPMPDDPSVTPLYTTPRQWQGLTEAEKVNVAIKCGCADVAWMDFADAIEAKLKAKNL